MCSKVNPCKRSKNHVDELQYKTDILLKNLKLFTELTKISSLYFATDDKNYFFLTCLESTSTRNLLTTSHLYCTSRTKMLTSFEFTLTGLCWEPCLIASRPKTSCMRLWRPRSVTCCSSTSTTRPISGQTTASVSLYCGNYLSSWPVSNCIMVYLHQLFCDLSTSVYT